MSTDRETLTKDTVQHQTHFEAFMMHCSEGTDMTRAHRRTFWHKDLVPDPVEGFPKMVSIEGPVAAHLCGAAAIVVALEGHPKYGYAWVEVMRGDRDRYCLVHLQTAIASALTDMEHIVYEGDEEALPG